MPQGINDRRLKAYVALQAAYGMEYLHANFMVHFDLKCGAWRLRARAQGRRTLKIRICSRHPSCLIHVGRKMPVLGVHHDPRLPHAPDNLLADLRDLNKPVVKIGDLGLSKRKKGSAISGNMRGTLPWCGGLPWCFRLRVGEACSMLCRTLLQAGGAWLSWAG